MRRWWLTQTGERPGRNSDDAVLHAARALADARNFHKRAGNIADRLEATRIRNHIAESLEMAIRPIQGSME